ncbi:hypothetical protein [Paenibacillus xylaniclasticus]|uniref:hypothetical protein n=1 Tax=Paenibacillus xylaniclasticus TaxID=588083 RepID=UPI000FD79E16|nr:MULTISPECIES: hypothetical protein [Paenibacillus]GFN30957.1 hypothetical protein PCURB6_12170 [Paenibacillus curdlanolyticus]
MEDFREKRTAWDWVVDQAEYVGEKAKEAWNSLEDFAKTALEKFREVTELLCEYIDIAMNAVNKSLDYLWDLAISYGANPLEMYFLTGVLKGLVDTIGGVLKLVVEAPMMTIDLVQTVGGYVTEVMMSDDPMEKLKDDIMSLPDKAVEM